MEAEEFVALARDLGVGWAMDVMSPRGVTEYPWQRVQSEQWKDDNLPRLPRSWCSGRTGCTR